MILPDEGGCCDKWRALGVDADDGHGAICLPLLLGKLSDLFPRLFKPAQHGRDLLRIGGRAENFLRVTFERLDPAPHVSGVVVGIMTDPHLGADDQRSNFGPQFLTGVTGTAERVG